MGIELGFIGLLTIILVFLKAFNIIDWSWIWVLSPLWISALIGMLIVILLIIIGYCWLL